MTTFLVFICIGLVIAVSILASKLSALKRELSLFQQAAEAKAEQRSLELLAQWKERELQAVRQEASLLATSRAKQLAQEWVSRMEQRTRQDAIKRSAHVVMGKVTEHLMPFLPEFPYNPKDARFLGSPVDLIVFNGLSDGNLQEVIFIEVKTGNSELSTRERQLRNIIQLRKVKWAEIRRSPPEPPHITE